MSIRSRLAGIVRRWRSSRPSVHAGERAVVGHPAPDANPWVRKDLDWDALAKEAPTAFERAYYGHKGRVMFKWAHYLKAYDRVLSPYVGKPVTLVEIGLAGGGSLQLWRNYLGPQVRIIGIDCEPGCRQFEGDGVEIHIGDQGDADFMRALAPTLGEVDIVIDDGSHINAHQILTFETLFPIVREGGVYVCEDLHTSYWPNYGGGLGRDDTFIGYSKAMIDKLHFDYGVADLPADDLSRSIGSMFVIDSLIAFEKARRDRTFMAWVGQDA